MSRIPILRIGQFLLVTIQVDIHDELALALQEDLSNRIVDTNAKGVLLDISALDMVDSFIARAIANISSVARLLDANTVVVGMQPAVAITLVELGIPMLGVRTALSMERGMDILRQGMSDEATEGPSAGDVE
ncbi:MAG: STAS domain-containing protein [Gemmatimonadaceae bacterium]